MNIAIDSAEYKSIVLYLKNKSFLVIDRNSAERVALRKFIGSLGVELGNIFQSDNFEEAEKHLREKKINFIFCGHDLGKKTAFDLINIHKEVQSNRLDAFFVMLSNHNSPALTTQSAAFEVDCLIVKPYKIQTVQDEFFRGLFPKVSPSAYLTKLEEAKELLSVKNYTKAQELLNEAVRLSPTEANPYFYLGKLAESQEKFEEAMTYWQKALEKDSVHFKSLSVMFSILIKLKNYTLAYEICNTLLKNYPLNPLWIPDMVRVCVANQKFDELLDVFDVFVQIEEKDEQMKKYMAAGLAFGSKFLLNHNRDKAVAVLIKASEFAGDNVLIKKSIISSLIKAGLKDKADEIFSHMSNDPNSIEIKLIDLEISNEVSPSAEVFQKAMQLVQKKVNERFVYEVALKRGIELERNYNSLEEICSSAIRLFPKDEQLFASMLAQAKKVP